MIDMVEAHVIAQQINAHLLGKRIAQATLAERKNKSMRDAYMLREKPEAFADQFQGATLTAANAKHRHVFLETDRGMGLDLWDVYGRILYVEQGAKIPGHPPLALTFVDGSSLVMLPGVWGGIRLSTNEALRADGAASDPDMLEVTSLAFTVAALTRLVRLPLEERDTIIKVLTSHATPSISGMMGAYGQEALYRAGIHPRAKTQALSDDDLLRLHDAIVAVAQEGLARGGRCSERDLLNQPGGFVPTVSKENLGQPCPVCGAAIVAITGGGAGKYYICPTCQRR